MTLSRDWLGAGIAAVLIAAAAAWLVARTEWVEIEVPIPPRGEAAKNPLFVTQQLARRLGANVATPTQLSEMPPPRATLLLTSWYWDLFPDRAQRLKTWVESGGHLVLYADAIDHDELEEWLPIRQIERPRRRADADAPPSADEEEDDEDKDSGWTPAPLRTGPPCHAAREPDTVQAAYRDGDGQYEICAHLYTRGWYLEATAPARWSIDGPAGPLILRTALGRGEVTVIQPWSLLDNRSVLQGDNAVAAMAALKVKPGVDLWFVTEEDRPSLLVWLWREAGVVIVLGALALALALWRSAPRFGPPTIAAPAGRRSMAEQITGTASFLRREGPEALLNAQVLALDRVAQHHVQRYDRLTRTERAASIAQLTGLNAEALGLALDTRLARRRVDLPEVLALLETARRLLAQADHRAPTRG